MALNKAKLINFLLPGFIIEVSVEMIKLTVSEKKLKFLLDVQGILNSASPSAKKTQPAVRSEIYEKKGMIENLNSIKNVIPTTVSVVIKDIIFYLSDSESPLCSITFYKSGFNFKLNRMSNIDANLFVTNFLIVDQRKEAAFSEIIANPYINAIESDRSDKVQLKISILLQPNHHTSDIGILLNDLRLTASKEFISALIQFYNKNAGVLQQPKKVEEVEVIPAYYMDFITYSRYTVCFKALEL